LSEEAAAASVPQEVEDVLKSTQIGYLSVTSKKGDLYSYPVAYNFSGNKVYMMTPIGSAKMKFMKVNPNVSFLVDNKKLALEACGAMIQGKAEVLSMAKMITSIVSLGPKMIKFAEKYPGMFTFYARGKYLPDERKLYKYRFIRINPSKVVYWTGYTFGKYIPKKGTGKSSEAPELKDPSKVEGIVDLLATADADEGEGQGPDKLPIDQDWMQELNSAVSSGVLSEDEMQVIGMYKKPLGVADNVKPGKISSGEKSILNKWKSSKTRE
jgi:hypothetical protein